MVSGGAVSGQLSSLQGRRSRVEEPFGGLFALSTDVEGSSVDSRVNLGTFGHHHEWAATDPQELSFDDAEPGTEHWHLEPEENFGNATPTVVDETIYITSRDIEPHITDDLVAYDAVTGEEQWRFETESRIASSPQVVGNTVFVVVMDDAVYALDATDGSEQWRSDFRVNINDGNEASFLMNTPSPTATDELVFVAGSDSWSDNGFEWDSDLYAVDAATGETQWQFEGNGSPISSPVVVEDTVFVVFRLDNFSESSPDMLELTLFAVDIENGDEQWHFNLDERVPLSYNEYGLGYYSSPTVANGLVYAVGGGDDHSQDQHLYSIDTTSGEQQWQFAPNYNSQLGSPTVANGRAYICSRLPPRHDEEYGFLYAIDAMAGDVEWRFEMNRAGPTRRDYFEEVAPTVAGEAVFISEPIGLVYALDEATGEQQWSFDTEGSPVSPPIVIDGTLFVASAYNMPPPKPGQEVMPEPEPEPEPIVTPEPTETEDQPGFGIPTALAGLAGAGYVLKRRLPDQGSEE